MGLYDRDYTQEGFHSQYRSAPRMRFGFAPLTPIVKKLLIINFAIFFIGLIFFQKTIFIEIETAAEPIPVNQLEKWFSVFPYSVPIALQPWRFITYQFLHGSTWHILINMLLLFFLGSPLERHWGGKKFLIFYLSCGAVGGLFYTLLVAVKFLPTALPMVGASGAILGLLAACAILFPHFVLFFVFFPVPIRIAALIFTFFYVTNLLAKGGNAGGDAAHLAGMAAGAVYVLSGGWRTRLKLKMQAGQWQKKIDSPRDLQDELDRILQKVHQSGIHSLTSKERKILRQATEAQKKRNGR